MSEFLSVPKIINPQFIWIQEGTDYRMALGSMGEIHLEYAVGQGWSVALNNCRRIHPTPCTPEGGFLELEPPKPIYFEEEFEAKKAGIHWAIALARENLEIMHTLLKSLM